MFTIHAKEKPKWYNLRWKLSSLIVKLARFVYPENPEVKAFIMRALMDEVICGASLTRIDPFAIFKTEAKPTEKATL